MFSGHQRLDRAQSKFLLPQNTKNGQKWQEIAILLPDSLEWPTIAR
jgi:hypothetical protein